MSGSERELVRRMLAADERAFDEFFNDQFPRLYRFALRRVDDRPEVAEEVAQAALIRAIDKLETFRGDSALFTWICTFCRNEISAWRDKVRRRRETEIVGEGDGLPVAASTGAAAPSGDPEVALLDEERLRRVRDTLDGLPTHYGDVLEWKYIDGLSVKEIAQRLGVSPKAAESTLTRARLVFRDAYTETGERNAILRDRSRKEPG